MERKSIFTSDYAVVLEMLRETRDKAGVTQVELAELLGRSQSFISKCERGESRLDIVQLREFCLALDTTLSDFVRRFEARLSARNRGGRKKRSQSP